MDCKQTNLVQIRPLLFKLPIKTGCKAKYNYLDGCFWALIRKILGVCEAHSREGSAKRANQTTLIKKRGR